jgi:hypothetical protein
MPFQVKLASPIGGVAANSVQAGPQGGQAYMIAVEFSHMGHGLTFLNRLESVCSFFVAVHGVGLLFATHDIILLL